MPTFLRLSILIIKIDALLKVLLFEALKANRCDYVRVLMNQGVQLDMDELNDLYVEVK